MPPSTDTAETLISEGEWVEEEDILEFLRPAAPAAAPPYAGWTLEYDLSELQRGIILFGGSSISEELWTHLLHTYPGDTNHIRLGIREFNAICRQAGGYSVSEEIWSRTIEYMTQARTICQEEVKSATKIQATWRASKQRSLFLSARCLYLISSS